MPTYDLASLVKINNQNLADIKGMSDLLLAAPLFAALEWTEASNGTKHQYLQRRRSFRPLPTLQLPYPMILH